MVNLHYLSTWKWQWAGQEGIKINKVVHGFAHYLIMLVNKVVGGPPTTLFSSERRYEAVGGFPTTLFSFGGVQRARGRDMVANKVVCGFHTTSIGSRGQHVRCTLPLSGWHRRKTPPMHLHQETLTLLWLSLAVFGSLWLSLLMIGCTLESKIL